MRPPLPVPSEDDYLRRWSAGHGGYDPRGSRWVRPWLWLVYRAVRPLARRGVAPDTVTLAGGLLAGVVALLAGGGGGWLMLAAALVVASALLDSLDGALAVLTDRATGWGYVLDSLVDRVSDGLYLVALWRAGAPAELCVAAGVLTVLQEYARARGTGAGIQDIAIVTVWERPTRVVVTAIFLAVAAIGLVLDRSSWAAAGAAAWVVLGAVGMVQLLVVLHRRLAGR